MLFDQPDFIARIIGLIRALAHNPTFHDDLLQDVVIGLWKLESADHLLRRTESWYLQRCRFLIVDWLKAGRSLDSPRHRHLGCEIQRDSEDYSDEANLIAPTETLQEVCARDIFKVLLNRLSASDGVLLQLLAQGLADTDIAKTLDLDRSSVTRRRHCIAETAVSLGMSL